MARSQAGVLKLWDGRSNSCVQQFSTEFDTTPISSIQFSSDSKHVLTASGDSHIRLWDVRSVDTYVLASYNVADATTRVDIGSFPLGS
jgi:cleavage stimulation factor subunit 1